MTNTVTVATVARRLFVATSGAEHGSRRVRYLRPGQPEREERREGHGRRRVKGILHQHLADSRLRGAAERRGAENSVRVQATNAAALRQSEIMGRGLGGRLAERDGLRICWAAF